MRGRYPPTRYTNPLSPPPKCSSGAHGWRRSLELAGRLFLFFLLASAKGDGGNIGGQMEVLCDMEHPLRTPFLSFFTTSQVRCSSCFIPLDDSGNLSRPPQVLRPIVDNKAFLDVFGRWEQQLQVHIFLVEGDQENLHLEIADLQDGTGEPVVRSTVNQSEVEISHPGSQSSLPGAEKSPNFDPAPGSIFVVSRVNHGALPLTVSLAGGEHLTSSASFKIIVKSFDSVDLSRFWNGSLVKTVAIDRISEVRTPQDARRLFGFATSFTIVREADWIAVHTDQYMKTGKPSSICPEGGKLGDATFVSCSKDRQEFADGCYNRNVLAKGRREIHIIQIKKRPFQISGPSLNRTKVKVHLKGSLHPTEGHQVTDQVRSPYRTRRNVTLVLRSDLPTLWEFGSSGLSGFVVLLVGADDEVNQKRSSVHSSTVVASEDFGLTVVVRRIDLPDSFDRMFLKILKSIGLPVSYTNPAAPSKIVIIVPGERENTDSVNAHALVMQHVRKECNERGVGSISLPQWVADRVGGVTMSYRDPNCRETRNRTHLILSSRLSDCGFLRENFGAKSVDTYTNFAHIKVGTDEETHLEGMTDDEDFEGSGSQPTFAGQQLHQSIPTVFIKCTLSSLADFSAEKLNDNDSDNISGQNPGEKVEDFGGKNLGEKAGDFGAKTQATKEENRVVVVEGMSTEAVVGVALVSFLIGVIMTAVIWLIYIKTDPRRRKRSANVSNRSEDETVPALLSGSLTPTSPQEDPAPL